MRAAGKREGVRTKELSAKHGLDSRYGIARHSREPLCSASAIYFCRFEPGASQADSEMVVVVAADDCAVGHVGTCFKNCFHGRGRIHEPTALYGRPCALDDVCGNHGSPGKGKNNCES